VRVAVRPRFTPAPSPRAGGDASFPSNMIEEIPTKNATSLRRLIEALEDRSLPSAYTVTDLGTFGGTESHGYAVNAAG